MIIESPLIECNTTFIHTCCYSYNKKQVALTERCQIIISDHQRINKTGEGEESCLRHSMATICLRLSDTIKPMRLACEYNETIHQTNATKHRTMQPECIAVPRKKLYVYSRFKRTISIRLVQHLSFLCTFKYFVCKVYDTLT